jgi:hypothetical protein
MIQKLMIFYQMILLQILVIILSQQFTTKIITNNDTNNDDNLFTNKEPLLLNKLFVDKQPKFKKINEQFMEPYMSDMCEIKINRQWL